MEKRVFFTGIDTWVWCMFIFAAVVAVVCTIGASLLVALPLWGVLLLGLLLPLAAAMRSWATNWWYIGI